MSDSGPRVRSSRSVGGEGLIHLKHNEQFCWQDRRRMAGPLKGGSERAHRVGALDYYRRTVVCLSRASDALTNVNSTLFELYRSGPVNGYVGRLNYDSIADLAWTTTLPNAPKHSAGYPAA